MRGPLSARSTIRRRLVEAAPDAVLRRRSARASLDALRRVAELAAGSGPLTAGPWGSEVGFELLYWLPFLAWTRDELGIEPERVVAVSRGGAGAWYGNVAHAAADLFSVISPDDLRAWQAARTRDRDSEKQSTITSFDRDLLARLDVPSTTGSVLHPSLMYRAFHVAWQWQAEGLLDAHLRFEALPRPTVALPELPADYVAVKLYASRCLPAGPASTSFAQDLVRALARRAPVVLLRAGARIDDHEDLAPAVDGVVEVAAVPIERNLELQSAIVASSRHLVTTYGGFSYLGPFLGVRTSSILSTRDFNPVHLRVLDAALPQLPATARFDLYDIDRIGAEALAEEILGA